MKKEAYMPDDDKGKVIFMNNYAGKLPLYATLLGISSADVTQVQNDAADFASAVNVVEAFKTYTHSLVQYKNHLRDGVANGAALGTLAAAPPLPVFSVTLLANIFLRISKQVATIKNNTNYTETIGKDLKIIGAETTSATGTSATAKTATLKPILSIKLNTGNVPHLSWKKGESHALRIMVDRGTGVFELLTVATHHTYIDKFALPALNTTAIWKYKAVYLDNDENEMGEWSEVTQITVTGV